MKKLVIMISGTGSNMINIHQLILAGKINAAIAKVISNKIDAGGVAYCDDHNIPVQIVSHTRPDFNETLLGIFEAEDPDYIVLAGFMRVLDKSVVDAFAGKIINIHPSILPDYIGLNAFDRSFADKSLIGATVHYVIPELDAGPIIKQRALSVPDYSNKDETRFHLSELEHRLYGDVLRDLC